MANGSRTRTAPAYLKCADCGNISPIHRKRSKMKERNHTKHMYCPSCRETKAHTEVKEDIFIPAWVKDWQEQWD